MTDGSYVYTRNYCIIIDDANDTATDDDVDANNDFENMNKENHKNNIEVSITQQPRRRIII